MSIKELRIEQIRFVSIVNSRIPTNNIIHEVGKEPPSEDKNQYKKELLLLITKSNDLRIKTGERVPIYSRAPGHKWFLTKDKYGILYLLLVLNSVDENIVYKLQGKLQVVVDRFYEDLQDGNQLPIRQMKELIDYHVDLFNNGLKDNPQAGIFVDSLESNKEIIEGEGVEINFGNKFPGSGTSDGSNLFAKIEKRQCRLFCLQMTTVLAFLGVIVLGAIDVLNTVTVLKGGK